MKWELLSTKTAGHAQTWPKQAYSHETHEQLLLNKILLKPSQNNISLPHYENPFVYVVNTTDDDKWCQFQLVIYTKTAGKARNQPQSRILQMFFTQMKICCNQVEIIFLFQIMKGYVFKMSVLLLTPTDLSYNQFPGSFCLDICWHFRLSKLIGH